MATWEDGPEYAPVSRPADFVAPEVAELSQAVPPARPSADAPAEQPDLQPPAAPVAKLSALAASPTSEARNPEQPFAVVQAIMTDHTSAWSAAHSAGSVLTSPAQTGWAAPTGDPVSSAPAAPSTAAAEQLGTGQRQIAHASPAQPIVLSGQMPDRPADLPAPGSDQWFGPGPGPGPAAAPAPITLQGFVASLTLPMIITVTIGGLLPPLSPLMFVVAFLLASRITVARSAILKVFTGASTVLGLVAIIAIFSGPTLSEWWSTLGLCSVVVCWLTLLGSAILTLRALQHGAQPPTGPDAARARGRHGYGQWG